MLSAFIAVAFWQQGFYQQVVPRPTGKNGYEEYVRAAAMVGSPQIRALTAWQPGVSYADLVYDPQEDEPSQKVYIEMLRGLEGKTPLEVARASLRYSQPILELVRKGNDKPVFSTREKLDAATLFPEFASFRQISRLAALSSEAMLADGRSDEAMRTLCDTMEMSSNYQIDTLIANLVGLGSQGMLLSTWNDQADRFSERDWQYLLARIPSWLDRPSPVLTAHGTEMKMLLELLDLAIAKPDNDLSSYMSSDDEEQSFLKAFQALSQEERVSMRRQVQDLMNHRHLLLERMLAGPESGWRIQPDVAPTTMAERYLALVTPAYDQIVVSNARVRTQLRLLRLHALVQIYRWHWKTYPSDLSAAVPQELLVDPLSGESFKFEMGGSSYRLYSKGSDQTGEIELRYRRPARPRDPNEPPMK